MANNIINNRILIRPVKSGLLKLLLISTLCTANLPVFSASNVPPVISGTPVPSVVAGNRYLFQPTASPSPTTTAGPSPRPRRSSAAIFDQLFKNILMLWF